MKIRDYSRIITYCILYWVSNKKLRSHFNHIILTKHPKDAWLLVLVLVLDTQCNQGSPTHSATSSCFCANATLSVLTNDRCMCSFSRFFRKLRPISEYQAPVCYDIHIRFTKIQNYNTSNCACFSELSSWLYAKWALWVVTMLVKYIPYLYGCCKAWSPRPEKSPEMCERKSSSEMTLQAILKYKIEIHVQLSVSLLVSVSDHRCRVVIGQNHHYLHNYVVLLAPDKTSENIFFSTILSKTKKKIKIFFFKYTS